MYSSRNLRSSATPGVEIPHGYVRDDIRLRVRAPANVLKSVGNLPIFCCCEARCCAWSTMNNQIRKTQQKLPRRRRGVFFAPTQLSEKQTHGGAVGVLRSRFTEAPPVPRAHEIWKTKPI